MPSDAYQTLQQGLGEVSALLRADPTPRGRLSPDPVLTRAVIRACVVILCSHFERYFQAINEEAIVLLNDSEVNGELLPERFRLQHSRVAVEKLAETEWTNRANGLRLFSQVDAWLWGSADKGPLEHTRIFQWMRTPKPKELIRFYRLWGISDIFTDITRSKHTRSHFFLKLTELVERRNNIAHGDFGTEATPREVRDYRKTVAIFCDRVDRRLARTFRVSFGMDCNWYR